jgi:hypothetical protein
MLAESTVRADKAEATILQLRGDTSFTDKSRVHPTDLAGAEDGFYKGSE